MFGSKKKIAAQVASRLNGDLDKSSERLEFGWYRHSQFPLLPNWGYRRADKENTFSWFFNWMFLKLWSLDSFSISIQFHIEAHWGFGFAGIIPYLRWVISIPCPPKLESWVRKKLWRKPKSH